MSDIPSFNARQCLKALKKLGFLIDKSKGKSGHCKTYFPSDIKILKVQKPFIIISLHGKFRLQKVILKELEQKGISKEKFIHGLKDNLEYENKILDLNNIVAIKIFEDSGSN